MTRHGNPWQRGEGRVVYDNPWIRLTEYQATAPTGRPAQYGLVSFKNLAMAILPIHADGTVELVGQNRLPFSDYSWEIPEGGGPLEDDPLASAQRELLEETGLSAANWQEVLRLQLSNSVTDELAIGYLATDLHQVSESPEGDGTEDIARARIAFRDLLAAVIDGHICDSLTVAMVLKSYHMAKEGALPRDLAAAMLG
jgi:8-oxo-dGTP pyrophosphatase MutT (NUDIX family)